MKRTAVLLVLTLITAACAAQSVMEIGFPGGQKADLINLSRQEGWMFSSRETPDWTSPDADLQGWVPRSPLVFPMDQADPQGRLEGWFRYKFRLDSALAGGEFFINSVTSGAARIFLDGREYGSVGRPDPLPDVDVPALNYIYRLGTGWTPRPVRLDSGSHTLAVYFTDHHTARLNALTFRNEPAGMSVVLFGRRTLEYHIRMAVEYRMFSGIWLSVLLLLTLLFGLLIFQDPKDRALRWIAWISVALTGSVVTDRFAPQVFADTLWAGAADMIYYQWMAIAVGLVPIALSQIVLQRVHRRLFWLLALCALLNPAMWYFAGLSYVRGTFLVMTGIVLALVAGICGYIVVKHYQRLNRSGWSLVAGLAITILWMLTHTVLTRYGFSSNTYRLATVTMIYLSLPVSFMVYIALRFGEQIGRLRQNLEDISALTAEKFRVQEEKQALVISQNERLEQEVTIRTGELLEKNTALIEANQQIQQQRDEVISSRNVLAQTLENLRAAQAQLIQSEKMASLGELTAGIAHEIKNPLNFVNNFAEVSHELLGELKEETDPDQRAEIIQLLQANLEKITQHGKRADGIVRSMLQHSRSGTGKREPTDINALIDEYTRLAYHGLRAKEKSFNAEIRTDLDPDMPMLEVVPEEMGRVLLNLINNAFYAVAEKQKSAGSDFVPLVHITTRQVKDHVEIRIADNGMGIAPSVAAKIFQPFFTTKPTGQGTGLGLSLSYDIVQAHGGSLSAEAGVDGGAAFVIRLLVSPG